MSIGATRGSDMTRTPRAVMLSALIGAGAGQPALSEDAGTPITSEQL
jgi:hypothetical protein